MKLFNKDKVFLVASRYIEAGEEIFVSYGEEFFININIFF